MSDPPVDPRTESDSGPGAQRPRPRSVIRPTEPPDDSLGMPTVQLPVGRASGVAPEWSAPPTMAVPVQLGGEPAGYAPEPAYQPVDEWGDPTYGEPPVLYPDPVQAFPPTGKPRVRKVSRVVRAVDAWSVFKVSTIFYLAMYVVCLVAGVLLWNVAYSTGTIDNISSFFESFGWKSFQFKGGEIFHNAWILGLFLVVGLTGLNVVLATLFNLITDLVGGIRFTVLEEEVVVRRPDGTSAVADPTAAGGMRRGAGWMRRGSRRRMR
jgi:hypothetical protein